MSGMRLATWRSCLEPASRWDGVQEGHGWRASEAQDEDLCWDTYLATADTSTPSSTECKIVLDCAIDNLQLCLRRLFARLVASRSSLFQGL